MLGFFRHSYPAQQIAIILLAVALWIPGFVTADDFVLQHYPASPLYNFIAGLFEFSPYALAAAGFATFMFCTFFFNSMLSVNQLVTRNSTIGALVFVLMMCCMPCQHSLYPFLIASPMIMVAVNTVFLIYQNDRPEFYLLNISVFLSLASMTYFPSILLFPWLIIALFVLEYNDIRFFFIPISTLTMSYFILFTFYYIEGSLVFHLREYAYVFRNLFIDINAAKFECAIVGIVLLIVVFGFFIFSDELKNSAIHIRKKTIVLVWTLLFSVAMMFTQEPLLQNGLFLLAGATLCSMFLSFAKKSFIINILLIIGLMAVVLNQYYPLIF